MISPAPATPAAPPSVTAPLLTWLVLNLLVLLIPLTQTQLADKFVRPAEHLAIEELAIAQILLGTLLFPHLFRTASTSICVIAASLPFLLIAGLVSARPLGDILTASAGVAAWLASLALLPPSLRTARRLPTTLALASAATLVPAALAYLAADFRGEWGTNPTDLSACGPIPGVLALLDHRAIGWTSFATALLACAVFRAITQFRERTRRLEIPPSPAASSDSLR